MKTGEAYPAALNPFDPHAAVAAQLDTVHAESMGFWNPKWKVSGHNHITSSGRVVELEETHSVDLGGKVGRLVIRFAAHGVPLALPQLYTRCAERDATRADVLDMVIDQTRDFLARLERARYLESLEAAKEASP